jgi:hypothetical protein
MVLHIAITARSSATSEQTAINLPIVCGVRVVTCTRSVPRKEIIFHPSMLQLPVGGRRKMPHPANYLGCRYAKEMQKRKSQRTPKTTTWRMFSSNLATPGVSFAVVFRGKTEKQQQPQTRQVAVAAPATTEQRVPSPYSSMTSNQQVRQFGFQM